LPRWFDSRLLHLVERQNTRPSFLPVPKLFWQKFGPVFLVGLPPLLQSFWFVMPRLKLSLFFLRKSYSFFFTAQGVLFFLEISSPRAVRIVYLLGFFFRDYFLSGGGSPSAPCRKSLELSSDCGGISYESTKTGDMVKLTPSLWDRFHLRLGERLPCF